MDILKLQNITIKAKESFYVQGLTLSFKPGNVYGIAARDPNTAESIIRMICGFTSPDTGDILLGKKPLIRSRLKALTGIASRSISLAPNMTVYDNIFLGRYMKHSRLGFLANRTLRTEAEIILASLETPMDSRRKVRHIGDNGLRIIEIARLLVRDPAVMILDRVTGSLSARQYHALFNIVSRLKASGKIILMVPSSPEDVRNFIDTLYFIDSEKTVEISDCKNTDIHVIESLFLSTGKAEEIVVNDPILKAKVIFDQHCTEPTLNCQAIAQSLGMGYENFRHKFKKETGMSPNQYFLKLKIERAKKLLIQSGLSIQDVAAKTGFPDPAHFSKLFKEKEKISPAEFRKKAIKGDKT